MKAGRKAGKGIRQVATIGHQRWQFNWVFRNSKNMTTSRRKLLTGEIESRRNSLDHIRAPGVSRDRMLDNIRESV